jgi:hypothetical protein
MSNNNEVPLNEVNPETTNQKLIDDIKGLQEIERELSDSLETNVSMTDEEKQKLVKRINNVSQMRINLYETLGELNKYYQTTSLEAGQTMEQQKTALEIIERELNESKQQIDAANQDKLNKLRMVEINDYFGSQYEEKAHMMKIVCFTMLPILLLVIIKRFVPIPDMLFNSLFALVLIIGTVYFLKVFASYIMRDNMRYQEYDWYFNKDNAPKADASADTSDPWVLGSLGTCIGQACCSDNLIYDTTQNMCIISEATVSEATAGDSTVNDELTKGALNTQKADVTL